MNEHLIVLAKQRVRKARQKSLLVWSLRVGLLVLALVIWEVAADRKLIDPVFFSRPTEVFAYMRQHFGDVMARNAIATLGSALGAFLLGSAAAIVIGFLLVRSPLLEDVLDPYITLLNAFPRVALAPLFIAWLGIGAASQIVTAITVIFFIVLLNVVAGAKSVDRDLQLLMKSFGAAPSVQFRKLVLPWAVPSIFAGLKLALIYAMLAVIVSEMMAGSRGLGAQVAYLSNTFHMDGVFAVLILVAVITSLLATGMNWLERRLLAWQQY